VTTGWLAPPDLSAHLLAGDVALLPYADGASGRRGSLLACAEHGLPIVTTEPAADEVAAYVHAVQPTSYDLAEGVLTVMSDRDRFRAKSLDLTEVMSWRRIASDHVELYNRLLYFGP
jgi:glycosyltransferase involved in cell wall biosynthesis